MINKYKDKHRIKMIYQNSTRETAVYVHQLQKQLGEDLHLIYTKEKNPQSVNEYV
jgi:hypothetical protein